MSAGRTCPLRFRYDPASIANAPVKKVQTLYVVGGLYGNVLALDAVEEMARSENATLCFNGDFNWFNVDDASFVEINNRVLAHDTILGNVEAELDQAGDEAGCGCAYPPNVDDGVVERSNQIHHRLKMVAAQHPQVLKKMAQLKMFARYQVGRCCIGVVHGDDQSLAGWRFDAQTLPSLTDVAFDAAQVDVFASSHTCAPALQTFENHCVINNGAAGMSNAPGQLFGLCTRISLTPSPHAAFRAIKVAGAHIGMLPIHFDAVQWQAQFLSNWPPGSAAWLSYFDRIRTK